MDAPTVIGTSGLARVPLVLALLVASPFTRLTRQAFSLDSFRSLALGPFPLGSLSL